MEENEKISIHSFGEKDFSRLVGLSESTYAGREISSNGYLDWEYNLNPDGKAVITTCEKEKKIIAQFIILPRSFSISNKIVKGSLSVNTLTHPDHRGKGLFGKMASPAFSLCRENEIQFTIGFPNPVSHPLFEKKMFFKTVGYLPLLFRPLNPFKSLTHYFKNRKNKSGDEIELNIPEKNFNEGVTFFDFRNDSDKYNSFLKRFNSKKQNLTMRSLQFLLWRYVNIPNRKYIILKLEYENEIIALAVFRAKYIFGLRCGILLDLMTIDDSKKTENILSVIRSIALNNKLDLLITTIPSHTNEYLILKKKGFFSMPQFLLPQKLAFIVKQHSENCPQEVLDFRKWFLTFGDYDIF